MTAVSLITQGDIEVNGVGPQGEQQSEQQGDHRRSWCVARTVIPSDVGFEPHRFACQGRPKWSTIADSSRPRTVKTSEFTMPNHEPAARPDPPAEPGPPGHDRPIPSGPLATPVRPADSAWGNLERRLLDLIVTNYTNGWQPAELLRHARREGTRGAAVLAAHAVAADHLGRPADAYHALWIAHVEGLNLPFDEGTGLVGRTVLAELFMPDDSMADALRTGAGLGTLRELADRQGFQSLEDDGRRLVAEGVTTMEEILRVNASHRLTMEERGDL